MTYYGSDGPRIIEFAEECLNDETTGQPIKLAQFQKDILTGLFELDADGKWKHKSALILLPRKCGKSMLGAIIALFTLVAKADFGAQIYCCAASKDQAEHVFRPFKRMVEMQDELNDLLRINKRVIHYDEYGSFFMLLSSDGKVQHGRNPVLTIVDETHAHQSSELVDAMRSGSLARRESMLIHITTPGSGESHFLYDLYKRGLDKQKNPEADPTFYFYSNNPPEGLDYKDPASWHKCHPGLRDGFCYEADIADALKSMHESEFRRLYMGEWTAAHSAWLPQGAWSTCLPCEPLQLGERLYLGVDGALSHDAIAVVGCTPDKRMYLLYLAERPDNADKTWHHDLKALGNCIRELYDLYDIPEIACDPFKIEGMLRDLAEDGLPIVKFHTNYAKEMTPALERFHAGVMNKEISHQHNADLQRHLDNALIESTPYGYRIKKNYKTSRKKHDAAIAAVIAHETAVLNDKQALQWDFI